MNTEQNLSNSSSSFDQREASDTFDKRPGCTDKGKEYEDLKIVQISINLLNLEDVLDFKIWGNDGEYGSMDDVIVMITKQNGDVMKIAMQLKHSADDKKMVSKNELTGPKGDFSLLKYFNDYQKAAKKKPQLTDYIFLLQTNKKICNEQMKLGDDLIIQPEEVDDPVAAFLSNNPASKPLRFAVKTDGKSDEYFTIKETKTDNKTKKSEQIDVKYSRAEFVSFLNKLYYYPQQPNVERIKTLCAEAFEKNFLSTEVKPFLDFVQDWSKRDGKKPKLTKHLLSAKVAECLLSPFIRTYQEIRTAENAFLFRKAIHQFDVTLIDETNAPKLGSIWNEDDVKDMQIEDENDFGLRRSGLHWDPKDVQKLLWHLLGRHLIVSLTQDNSAVVSKAMTLSEACGRRKFLFVINDQVPKLPHRYIFQNFDNLQKKDAMLFESLGKSLKVSLEGKEAIPLKEIVGDVQVRTHLTPSHFLRMLEEPLLIGQIPDKFPDYYINRLLTDYHIDFNYVNNMETDKNITLICSNNVDFAQIQEKFPNVREWSDMTSLASGDESKNLYFCNNSQKETVFEKICTRNMSKNCVRFEYSEEDPTFKWLESNNIDPNLHRFQSRIPETAIKTEDYLLNILCNDPGMGKSWFLKRLKLNYPSKIVIYIEPKNQRFFDKKPASEAEYDTFLLSVVYKDTNELDQAIFSYLYLDKRVVILWDGLDEVSREKLPNILSAIDYFKNIGLSQWIASRDHLRERLENYFNVLSRSIVRLDAHQQEEYIKQRLRNNEATISSCENITKTIMNHLKPNYVNTLFGIPLQLFMLTELFLHQDSNISEELTSGRFSIATLYQHFLDGKFKFHEEEKIGYNLETANDQVADLLLKSRNSLEENFEKAAMRGIFPFLSRTMMVGDDFSCDQFLDDIMTKGDNYGMITFIVKSNYSVLQTMPIYEVNFAHQTFGEFLAARYLTKSYHNNDQVTFFLAHERVSNVRFFFDVMMADVSELHLAVLYKDVEKVKRLKKRPDCKDRLGRNPLTLAVSWGKYKWRRYYLIPKTDHLGASIARDNLEPPSKPTDDDDALAEIFSDLNNSYKLSEEINTFLFEVIRSSSNEEDSSSHWPLLNKQIFDSIPGPSYVDCRDGYLTKWIAVANIPSFNEIATRCLFHGMKALFGIESPNSTSTSCCYKCTLL